VIDFVFWQKKKASFPALNVFTTDKNPYCELLTMMQRYKINFKKQILWQKKF
jgi:hypothetical protein